MILMDHLLVIEKIETLDEKETYASGLYLANKTFREYADMAYKQSLEPRYQGNIPDFVQDNQPYGYHLSQLEKLSRQVKTIGFIGETEFKKEVVDKKMIQTFESLSDVENRFLTNVLNKQIPWFSREKWKQTKMCG